jgi:hypothetical protein
VLFVLLQQQVQLFGLAGPLDPQPVTLSLPSFLQSVQFLPSVQPFASALLDVQLVFEHPLPEIAVHGAAKA